MLYLDYGLQHEKLAFNEREKDYLPADTLTEIKRGLFFKASYNWRL